MCQAYTGAYVAALNWLAKKGHDRCVEVGEWSYWCEVCDFQKKYDNRVKPVRVDPDAYGYYELGKAPESSKIKP